MELETLRMSQHESGEGQAGQGKVQMEGAKAEQ